MENKSRYQVGEKIAQIYEVYKVFQGGMGEVYLCVNRQSYMPVAIKTFQVELAQGTKVRKLFENEAAIWSSLGHHPNIVGCMSLQLINNQPYLILEWVDNYSGKGTSLRNWLYSGPIPLRKALEYAIDICQGMAHAGAMQPGIVHRDIKPENLLLSSQGMLKITDFGLAKIVESSEVLLHKTDQLDLNKSSLGNYEGNVGTPLYMAPEQWQAGKLDHRTDIYAVGCVLFEMITGQAPFDAPTIPKLRIQHLEADSPKLPDYVEGSIFIDPIIQKCLEKEPDNRFSSFEILGKELIDIYKKLFNYNPQIFNSSNDYTDHFQLNQAVILARLKQYDSALNILDSIKATNGDNPIIHTNAAVILDTIGRYDEAIKYHEKAESLSPFNERILLNKGTTLNNLGNHQQAIRYAEKALEIYPHNAYAYRVRGTAYLGLGQTEAAYEDFSKSIQLEPNDTTHYYDRGTVNIHLKRYNYAIIDFNRALELDSTYAAAFLNRGVAYEKLDNYENAISDYKTAIQLSPEDSLGYIKMGTFFGRYGQLEEALTYFEKAANLDSSEGHEGVQITKNLLLQREANISQLKSKAFALVSLRQYEEAINVYTQLLQLTPKDVDSIANRGVAFERLGKYEEAIKDHTRAIELDNSHIYANFGRGVAYELSKQYELALVDFLKTIEIDPTLTHAHFKCGNCYFHLGRMDECLRSYTHAITLDPTYADAYNNRSKIYEQLEQFDEAISDCKKLCEIEPNNKDNHERALYLLLKYGHSREEALKYAERAGHLGSIDALGVAQELRELLKKSTSQEQEDLSQVPFLLEAFFRAKSFEEMRLLTLQMPAILTSEYASQINQFLDIAPPEFKEEVKKRWLWLQKLIQEKAKVDIAPPEESDNTDKRLQKTLYFIETKQYQRAIESISKLIEDNADIAVFYSLRGECYRNISDHDNAFRDFEKALLIDKQLPEVYSNRGLMHHELGRYSNAIEDFDKALEIDPDLANAYYNRGLTYYAIGRYDIALANISKSIELDPTDPQVYYSRGLTFFMLEKYSDAIEDYSKAIEMNANYMLAYLNRGVAKKKLNFLDEALKDLIYAINLDFEYPISHYFVGLIYIEKNEVEKALKFFQKASDLGLVDAKRAIEHFSSSMEGNFVTQALSPMILFTTLLSSSTIDDLKQSLAGEPFFNNKQAIKLGYIRLKNFNLATLTLVEDRLLWVEQILNEL